MSDRRSSDNASVNFAQSGGQLIDDFRTTLDSKTQVKFWRDGAVWVVELILSDDLCKDGLIFAFYLVRDGKRSLHRWYAKDTRVHFVADDIPGVYFARAFIKFAHGEARDVQPLIIDSSRIAQAGHPYNLNRWSQFPQVSLPMATGFSSLSIDNGLYHFVAESNHCDILLTGMAHLKSSRVALVCFGGAVSTRAGTAAPFFSGLALAEKLNMPMVSVADPSLGLSHDLTLGWYAGYKGFNDLPKHIALLLDSFAEKTGVRLILFGGSGGGFASLLVLSYLRANDASAFVWNPQTSIARYAPAAVSKYLSIGFSLDVPNDQFYSVMDQVGLVHDLTQHEPIFRMNKKILYIQNASDWHVKAHAQPFLGRFSKLRQIEADAVVAGRLVYWESTWGAGHAVPTDKIISAGLRCMLENSSPRGVINLLRSVAK